MNKKKKILIITLSGVIAITTTIAITIFFITYLTTPRVSTYNNFCCKSIKGIIVKIDEDIKKYKEIELNNEEKHYLGLYLGKKLATVIQIGDSIYKDKNSMKIIFYRNNEIIGYNSNTYYTKRINCECN